MDALFTLGQLYTLTWSLKRALEFAQPVHMCFVAREKSVDHVPQGTLWGFLQEHRILGLLLKSVIKGCSVAIQGEQEFTR